MTLRAGMQMVPLYAASCPYQVRRRCMRCVTVQQCQKVPRGRAVAVLLPRSITHCCSLAPHSPPPCRAGGASNAIPAPGAQPGSQAPGAARGSSQGGSQGRRSPACGAGRLAAGSCS